MKTVIAAILQNVFGVELANHAEADARISIARREAYIDGFKQGFEKGKERPRFSNGRFKKTKKAAADNLQSISLNA